MLRWLGCVVFVAACGGREVVPPRAAPRSPPPSTAVEAAPPRLSLRSLDLEHADCTSGPLATWAQSITRGTDVDVDGATWTDALHCRLTDATDPSPQRGPQLVDLDGDGTEEALAYVELQHTQRGERGNEPRHVGGIVVLRAGASDVTPALTVLDGVAFEAADGLQPEGCTGARTSGTHVYVATQSGCYDCGCDTVELDFDCASGTCRYAGKRTLTQAEPCDSP